MVNVNHYWSKVVESKTVDDVDEIATNFILALIFGSITVFFLKKGIWPVGILVGLLTSFCLLRIFINLFWIIRHFFRRKAGFDDHTPEKINPVPESFREEQIRKRKERKRTRIGEKKSFNSRRFYK